MQTDFLPDDLRTEDGGIKRLSGEKYARHEKHACHVRPELYSRQRGRGDQTQRPANKRNEAHESRQQPDQKPVAQTEEAQRDGIEHRQHEAHHALAADERRDATVDLGRQSADRRSILTRQPAFDLGQHFRPIDKGVEKYERRDEHQREEAEGCGALTPQCCSKPRQHARKRILHTRKTACDGGFSFGETVAKAFAGEAFEQTAQAREFPRKRLDEAVGLSREHRHQEHEQRDDQQDREQQDDDRGQPARHAERTQRIDERIEKVSERQADNERQEHRRQEMQQAREYDCENDPK